MEYNNDKIKYEIGFYYKFIDSSIKYYKDIIKEYDKKDFYIGLYMAVQFKKIISGEIDSDEITVFYEALKSNLGKQGTQWDQIFLNFESWKVNYFDINK
jgi:hypothetical protein